MISSIGLKLPEIIFRKYIFILYCIFIISNLSAQIKPHEAIKLMQKGINLGNTHEPPQEAGWNNPKAEDYYFDLYKTAGFQCIRIPVRWDNYTGKTAPYKIDDYWLNRIEQVAEWGLSRGFFIVINTHHEEWIKSSYTEANKARFDSIWSQIAKRFQNKTDRLIFEIINEPHGLTKAQNDDLHARVLSIIRKTNPKRLVIFQGHNWGGSDELITAAIPKDSFLIGSFHSYDPYLFGLEGQGTWGTSADYAQLESKFKKVSDWSIANKIPVFLGEFGSLKKCEFNSRMRHYRAYVELSQKYGFAAIAWDDGGDFRIMERQQNGWNELKDILISTNKNSPTPAIGVYQDSVIRIQWTNKVANHDSIFIQRRIGTLQTYQIIARLKPDVTQFLDVKPVMNQTYTYRIIASYTDSTELISQPYQVFFPTWTKPARVPFHGSPLSVPGTIQAEDFDKGGEGFTYHDADQSNIPGKYRPSEAVDIYERPGDGFHVGNIIAGEWYEYSVNIKTTGIYNITFYFASYFTGGKFSFSVDSLNSDILTVIGSGSNLNTKPVLTQMNLHSGNRVLRFNVVSASQNYNFDKVTFDLATSAQKQIEPHEKPFAISIENGQNLIIDFQHKVLKSKIGLFSSNGQLLYLSDEFSERCTVPVGHLPAGVYIVSIANQTGKFSEKIIIH